MPILPRSRLGYQCVSEDGKLLLNNSCSYIIYLIVAPFIFAIVFFIAYYSFKWMKTTRGRSAEFWARRGIAYPACLCRQRKAIRSTVTRGSGSFLGCPVLWNPKNTEGNPATRSSASEGDTWIDTFDPRHYPAAKLPPIPQSPPPVYLVPKQSTDSDAVPPPSYTYVPPYSPNPPMPHQ